MRYRWSLLVRGVWRRLHGRRSRRPREVIARRAGSCFCGSGEPRLIRLSDESDGVLHDIDSCLGLCRDPYCQEWANVQIIEGPHRSGWMCHLSECQMEDPTPEDWARYDAERQTALAPAEAGQEASDGE